MKKYLLFFMLSWLWVGHALAQTNVPGNLVAAAQTSTSIRLTWTDNSTNETGFEIEQSADNRTFTKVADAAANATTFTIASLAPNTVYYFRIRAKFVTNNSTYSNTANATTLATPPVVGDLKAAANGTTSIRLTWTDVGKEALYNIERRTGQSGAFAKIATAGINYTDNNLTPGTEYCYRVQFVSSIETAGYSNIACASTQQAIPNAPARLTAQAVSSSQINLTWADLSSDETGFQVERASSPTATFTKIADLGINTTTYSDGNLGASTQYCYRVRAINPAGTSGYTDVQCATTQAPPLTAPQNLVATAASATQINLTWNTVANATGYQLERSPNGNDSWTKIADPASNATTYADQNLAPNTRYFYRIRAVISGAAFVAGPYSNVVNAITPDVPPNAPARLTATAVSFSQINLAWADLSANETGFQLERSTDGAAFTKIADLGVNTTTYNDVNLAPSTRYFYRIRAVNAVGASAYSNTADATTPVGPPAAPQNLAATAASTTQINLTWNAVANAANVLIERSPNGTDSWTQIASVAGNATTYADPNLAQNTRYFYRIRGTNASGNGPYSSVANATTPDAPPAAPARLTATAVSFSQINLTWADLSNNESGFQLDRSTDGTTFTKIADIQTNTTTYSDQNLSPRTRYFYRIRAINAAGNSAYSNTADATTPDAPPTAPARLTATAISLNQINLAWADQSDNETGFELERSPNGNTWTKIADIPVNTTTFSNTGLTPNTRYVYRIRAVNAVGQSAYSNTAEATTPNIPPPTAPTNLTAITISATQINLSWTDNATTETGFEIERSTDGTTFTKIADVGANVTSFQNTGLTPATRYFYRIRAVNAGGNSAYSNVAEATTLDVAPNAPARLTATAVSYNQINLAWADLSANETGFEIEQSTDGTTFTKIGSVGANVTAFQATGLSGSTRYFYRVRAVNGIGPSQYSNIADATTQPAPVPDAPTNLKVESLDFERTRLTWSPLSANATGVSVERSTNPTSGFVQIGQQTNASNLQYFDIGILPITTYYYRVRATNAAGASAYSNVAKLDATSIITATQQETAPVYVADQTLFVRLDKSTSVGATVRVISLRGLIAKATTFSGATFQTGLDDVATGVYVVLIETDTERITQKIVVK